jgi:hypothetical protein
MLQQQCEITVRPRFLLELKTRLDRYAAGSDTVVSAISSFFLVMSLCPEVQKRGQREIDKVIGPEHRLPLFTDRPQMPFIVSYIP